MKKRSHIILWFVAVSALCGAVLATWLAPSLISWYFAPPAQFGVNCLGPIEWALSRFRWAQLVGAALGAILGLVLSYYWTVRRTHTINSPE
jgi:hypothetical protein